MLFAGQMEVMLHRRLLRQSFIEPGGECLNETDRCEGEGSQIKRFGDPLTITGKHWLVLTHIQLMFTRMHAGSRRPSSVCTHVAAARSSHALPLHHSVQRSVYALSWFLSEEFCVQLKRTK